MTPKSPATSEATPTSVPTTSVPTPSEATPTPTTSEPKAKMVREDRDYRVGLTVSDAQGAQWKIVDMALRVSPSGYRTRLFTLERVGSNERRRATARGLTLYSMHARVSEGTTPATPKEPAPKEVARVDEGKARGLARHHNHEALLRAVRSGANVWLFGPKGSSKSTAALCVAADLGLRVASQSVCRDTTAGQLMGFVTMAGVYSPSVLRDYYENGGVFLLDEVDAGNPTVLLVLNNLLANDYVTFPDGKTVKKHPLFFCIAAANTLGNGPESGYVGRNPIDEASKDRFIVMTWGYDRTIAAAMAGVPLECVAAMPQGKAIRFERVLPSEEVLQERCATYVTFVAKVMGAIDRMTKGEPALQKHMPSPRSMSLGTRLIREGFSVADAYEVALWKGLATALRQKIEAVVASMP